MQLTEPQLATLKAAILASADPAVIAAIGGGQVGRNDTELARLYNQQAASYVWRTDVQRAEIYHQTSAQGTAWNWTTYKAQNVTEQNAWTQMFMGDTADFSLPNLRAGVEAIFSGAGAPALQRTHVSNIAKRFALKAEAIFVTGGVGTFADPATLSPTAIGEVTIDEIGRAFQG